MSLWRCHLKNWWKVYSSFPLQKQLMRSPGENVRLWDLNWEIESSGRNAHLMHKCIVNNIATRVFCGFYLGFLAWRAVVQGRGRAGTAQQCQEDDVINQTCNLFALADSFYCKIVHLWFQSNEFKELWLAFITQGKVPRAGWHFTLHSGFWSPIFQGHERGHSAASSAAISDAISGKVKLPRCRGVKAGGSQQTRLNKWL